MGSLAATQKKLETVKTKNELLREQLRNKQLGKILNYTNTNADTSRYRKSGWTNPDAASRDLSDMDRSSIMARARQKVEETPLGAALLRVMLDNVVQTGFRLAVKSDSQQLNNEVEEWWNGLRDKIELRGQLSWCDFLRTCLARMKVDGDIGIANVIESGKCHFQLFESDRITGADHIGDNGIVFDQYGRPLSYHIKSRNLFSGLPSENKTYSFAAKDFLLFATDQTYRCERARGFSEFTQVLNLLEDYEEIMLGIVQKVKNETFIGLFFKMEAPSQGISPFGDAELYDEEEERAFVKMKPGLNIDGRPGEDIKLLGMETPNANFIEFEKTLLSRIGMPFGLTYELITGDYSQINYVSARAQIEQAKRHWKHTQGQVTKLADWIFQKTYNHYRKANSFPEMPRYQWLSPQWPYLDIEKEARAIGQLVAMGITTRKRFAEEQYNEEIQDIFAQLKTEQDQLNKLGLFYSVGMPGQTIANYEEPQ